MCLIVIVSILASDVSAGMIFFYTLWSVLFGIFVLYGLVHSIRTDLCEMRARFMRELQSLIHNDLNNKFAL